MIQATLLNLKLDQELKLNKGRATSTQLHQQPDTFPRAHCNQTRVQREQIARANGEKVSDSVHNLPQPERQTSGRAKAGARPRRSTLTTTNINGVASHLGQLGCYSAARSFPRLYHRQTTETTAYDAGGRRCRSTTSKFEGEQNIHCCEHDLGPLPSAKNPISLTVDIDNNFGRYEHPDPHSGDAGSDVDSTRFNQARSTAGAVLRPNCLRLTTDADILGGW